MNRTALSLWFRYVPQLPLKQKKIKPQITKTDLRVGKNKNCFLLITYYVSGTKLGMSHFRSLFILQTLLKVESYELVI